MLYKKLITTMLFILLGSSVFAQVESQKIYLAPSGHDWVADADGVAQITVKVDALQFYDDDYGTTKTFRQLGVAAANSHTSVTLAPGLDYLGIAAQVITLLAIDLATDVTGVLDAANIDSAMATDAELALKADINNPTFTGTVSFPSVVQGVQGSVSGAGDIAINSGTSGAAIDGSVSVVGEQEGTVVLDVDGVTLTQDKTGTHLSVVLEVSSGGTGAASLAAAGIAETSGGAFVGSTDITYTDASSSGSPVVFLVAPTYNQTGTAGATDLKINRTETAVGSGAQYLVWFGVGGVEKASIDNVGNANFEGTLDVSGDVNWGGSAKLTSTGYVQANRWNATGGGWSLGILNWNNSFSSAIAGALNIGSNTQFTSTSGDQTVVKIMPKINQTSGTGGYTALRVEPVETSTGSGVKYLASFGTAASPDKVTINNAGDLTVSGNTIIATKTPASATATGTAGEVAWDSSYIYICTATNTWTRVAIATW